METINIPLSKIEVNKGQIEGLPSNPRLIRDNKFRLLMQSIEENPEMLQLRELLVVPHGDKYVIIGGNMRFKALRALKYKDAPCKVIPDADELDFEKMSKADMKKLLETIYSSSLPTTIIDEKKPTKDSEHSTMKPVRLFGYQMQNSTRRGDIVLDTFGGSGTTMVAAEQLGRKARLMELDPHYCDVIIARYEKLTGKKAIKEE